MIPTVQRNRDSSERRNASSVDRRFAIATSTQLLPASRTAAEPDSSCIRRALEPLSAAKPVTSHETRLSRRHLRDGKATSPQGTFATRPLEYLKIRAITSQLRAQPLEISSLVHHHPRTASPSSLRNFLLTQLSESDRSDIKPHIGWPDGSSHNYKPFAHQTPPSCPAQPQPLSVSSPSE